jgi:predicted MFS family arabinose efflux permease
VATAPVALSWRRGIEPWYGAYALLGATAGGLLSILLPLHVNQSGHAAHVGLVMSAVGVGGLTAAVWGGMADRYRWHRALFAGGALAAALAFLGFPVTSGVAAWFTLALVLGIGVAAANTVANLFVVEAHAQPEWDARIGWLQAFFNGGGAIGLMLAGLLAALGADAGLVVGAGLTALAAALGWATTRTPPRPSAPPVVRPQPVPQHEWSHSSPQRLIHYPTRQTLRRLAATARSPFGVLLVVWTVSNLGTQGVYALYPLLMQNLFDLPPGPSSTALGFISGLEILLFPWVSPLVDRIGATRVLQAGLALRLAALLGLIGLSVPAVAGRDYLTLLVFAPMSLAWPLLTVSSTLLTSALSPRGEGEALGIYNAIAGAAGLLGPALGGWVAQAAGYQAVLVLGVAGIVLALPLTLLLRPPPPTAGGSGLHP